MCYTHAPYVLFFKSREKNVDSQHSVENPHASRPDMKKTIGLLALVAGIVVIASYWEALKALFGM